MKKRNVEKDVVKDKYFVMEEYTEFLRIYLGKRRDITRIVFKIVGRIYKAVKSGMTKEQVEMYITMLRKTKRK